MGREHKQGQTQEPTQEPTQSTPQAQKRTRLVKPMPVKELIQLPLMMPLPLLPTLPLEPMTLHLDLLMLSLVMIQNLQLL